MRAGAVLLGTFLLWPRGAGAAFEDADFGPRAGGMGGAFAAVGEGAPSPALNPAGLALARKPEAFLGFARLHELAAGPTSRTDLAAGLAGPAPGGPPAGWGTWWRRSETDVFAKDQRFGAGYAVRGLWESPKGRLDVGAGASLLKRESLSRVETASAGALDLGVLLHWGSRYRWGASLLNLNQPSTDLNGVADRAPRTLRVGMAGTLPFWTFAVDFAQRASSALGSGGFTLAAGLEHWWSRPDLGAAALRSGLSLGSEGRYFALGSALQRGGAELQYTAQFPLTSRSRVGHQLAFAFYFGGREPRDVYQQLLRSEIEARRELQRLIETQEETLAKLRQDLLQSRIELERLRVELEARKAEGQEASEEKLKWLLELQDQLRQDLRKAEAQRRSLEKKKEEPLWREELEAYRKLKASGAPPHVLAETLRGLLDRYRGTGADLSEAYREFVALQGAP